MKRLRLLNGVLYILILTLGPSMCFSQKGSGNGGKSSGDSGGDSGSGGAGKSSGSQGSGASSAASPSNRIEAGMLVYEASDKIAAHIAARVKDHTLYIYDSQSFASLQAYEAYSATVSAFEISFKLFIKQPATSSFVTSAGAVQTITSSLGALRSSTEYAAEAVDFQTDPVIAQVANHVGPGKVIVPRLLFINSKSDDLVATAPDKIEHGNCSDIQKNVPDQLGCLLVVRNDASVAVSATTGETAASKKAAFADLDKLFQVFFGQLMGSSVNLTSSTSTPGATGGGGGAGGAAGSGGARGAGSGGGGDGTAGGGGNKDKGGGSSSPGSSDGNQPSTPVPLLSQIIQGHRLKAQFANDTNSRVLILEATQAGGGSRIKHNFFVELFWTTPTPSFTGGAIVTYLLIDPAGSRVEKSGVLRFMVDYGRFHGKKIQRPSNFEEEKPGTK